MPDKAAERDGEIPRISPAVAEAGGAITTADEEFNPLPPDSASSKSKTAGADRLELTRATLTPAYKLAPRVLAMARGSVATPLGKEQSGGRGVLVSPLERDFIAPRSTLPCWRSHWST